MVNRRLAFANPHNDHLTWRIHVKRTGAFEPNPIIGVKLFLACLLFGTCLLYPTASPLAAGPKSTVEMTAMTAERYQDHARNEVRCEVFGEIKNVSDRLLLGVTVTVDFLDAKGKKIATEDIPLELRVVHPRSAKGDLRPVKPNEYGNFIQDTANCPSNWLEGRIHYKVKKVDLK
jgi:hypothetical protein